MNRIVFTLSAGFLYFLLLFSCQQRPEHELEVHEMPFNANIRCIKPAIDKNCILLGMENGILVRKELLNDITDTIFTGSRVYDVVEQQGNNPSVSKYWIGVRNMGLLEVSYNHKEHRTYNRKVYAIPEKGIRYSPYTIEMIGADLYIGTSSGLFRKKTDDSPLEKVSNCYVSKIAFSAKDNSLFLATNRGVFRYYMVSGVIDTIKSLANKKSEIRTIHIRPDNTLDIVDGNTLYNYNIDANRVQMVRDFSLENLTLVDCIHTADASWYITNRKVIYKKGNKEFVHPFTGNVTYNNSLITTDFLMVPCLDKLMYFPLHDIDIKEKDDIMAVSNTLGNTTYCLARDFTLYAYKDGRSEAQRIKHIDGISDDITQMQVTKNHLWLCSSRCLYRIDKDGNNKISVKEIEDSPSMYYKKEGINTFYCATSSDAVETGLYIGQRNRLLYASIGKVRGYTSFDTVQLEKDYDKNNDLFINNILPKGDSIFILTLNQGLYYGKLHARNNFVHISAACSDFVGNPTSFVEAKHDGLTKLIILSNRGLFEYDMQKKTIEEKKYPSANQIKALISGDQNNIYLLGHRGIKKYPHEENYRFKDISFETATVSPHVNTIIYASKTGLHKLDYNTMKYELIPLEKGYKEKIRAASILIFGLFAGLLVFLFMQIKKQKYKRIKELEDKLQLHKSVENELLLKNKLMEQHQLIEQLREQLQEETQVREHLQKKQYDFSENGVKEIKANLNVLLSELHIKGRFVFLKNSLDDLFEECFYEDILFKEAVRSPEKRQVTMLALIRYFKSSEVNQLLRLHIADATIDSWRSFIREELRQTLRKETCKNKEAKHILLENLSGKKETSK